MPQNAFFPRTRDLLVSPKTTQRHFFSTLHPLSPVFFPTATVVAFVLLRNSRFSFRCYTQCEATPTQKSARKWRRDLLRLLARKITKGIHLCKPASLNRPIAGLCTSPWTLVGMLTLDTQYSTIDLYRDDRWSWTLNTASWTFSLMAKYWGLTSFSVIVVQRHILIKQYALVADLIMSTHTTPVGFVLSMTRNLGTIRHYLRTPCGTLDKREDHKKQRRDCVLLWTTWRFVLERTLKYRAWGVRCMLGMQQSQAWAVCLFSGSLRRRHFRSKRHVPHEQSRMVCTITCRIFPWSSDQKLR